MSPASPDDLFPLTSRSWIPVRVDDGTERIGLRKLFLEAHNIDGLAVALPPAAAGLMRVLCAMTARITGLCTASGYDEWEERRWELLERSQRGFVREDVEDYLTEHEERLRLHDPHRPFLQDPRLAEQSPSRSGVNKLVMARPAGNNHVFFGHFTDAEQVPLPSEEAVLHLLAQLYYGPSGQCTPRTVDGQRFGNTMAGPLRRAMSYHPVGRSLFETLVLGIPGPDAWLRPTKPGAEDGCPWERAELPEPLALPDEAAGVLSMLTEQYQHAVLLHPDQDGASVVDATITWAFRAPRPPLRDPYQIWDEGRDGEVRPREAKAERSLWRDLDGLVLTGRGDHGRRPLIMDGLRGGALPEAVFDAVRVQAYGFDQDGQTRDRTYFAAATPPLLALLKTSGEADNALARGVREGRETAELAEARLSAALRTAWRAYTTPFGDPESGDKAGKAGKGGQGGKKKTPSGPWPAVGQRAYWPAAEERFWDHFAAGDFTHALRTFARLALEIYDEVTAPVASTPRGAKAREQARGIVRSLLDRDPRQTSPAGTSRARQ